MKTIIGSLVVVGILGGIIYGILNERSEVVVQNVQKETEVIEVHPEWATDEDAIKAAQDVIRKKELEAQEAQLVGEITAKQEVLDEVRKELGTYWKDPSKVKALIRQTFPEDPATAIAVAYAESGMRMVQSNHTYPKNMDGQSAGSRERSFCIYQIHEPAHHATAVRLGLENYKTDIEDCVAMARVVYDQAGGWSPWTVYTKRMYVAYLN